MAVSTKKGPKSNEELALNGEQSTAFVHELEVRHIGIRVVGMPGNGLILHAWSEKAIKTMADTQGGKAKKGKDPKDPVKEFESCFYRNELGEYCFPASGFKKAMVSAATSIDDKRFPKTKIRQAVFVNGDLLPIIYKDEPVMRCDPVRLNGKTADLRYRPEFKEWAIDLSITYNAKAVTQEQVVNLINLAGFAVGIGEWRPEKDGSFGRFQVQLGARK